MAHVLAFAAPKGGIGTTTLALCMATALRKHHGPKIALIEGDLMFGDLATMVGMRPDRSLLDVLDKPRPWTANLVSGAISHHPILDFDVVLAPAEAHLAEKVTARQIGDFLDALDKRYDFILVDMASNISDREAEVFERAAAIYVLTGPDPVSVSATRKLIKVLSLLRDPIKKTALLCNRGPASTGELDLAQLEAGIGLPILREIPRGKPAEFELSSLKILEPFSPFGAAQKAICDFIREVRDALWTGRPAPGISASRRVSAPSFNPFVAVAGRDLSAPQARPDAPGGGATGGPVPPRPPPAPAARADAGPAAGQKRILRNLKAPPPRPPPMAPAGGDAPSRDRLRQTLSERLRISRSVPVGEVYRGPVAPPSDPDGADPGPAPPASLPAPRVPGGKVGVLIVDDNEGFRTGLARALGFERRLEVVGEAADGVEALAKIPGLRPDLILIDANMPGMGGLDTLDRLGRMHPEIPALMMSVQEDPELVAAATQRGARAFLRKPFEPEEVSRVVAELYPE